MLPSPTSQLVSINSDTELSTFSDFSYIPVNSPKFIAGGVFAAGLHKTGVSLPYAGFHAPGVECELAVTVARDLTPRDKPYELSEMTGCSWPAKKSTSNPYPANLQTSSLNVSNRPGSKSLLQKAQRKKSETA